MHRPGPSDEIVAETDDGMTTVEAIIAHSPDLVFLDIKMPGLDGFEVLAGIEDAGVQPSIIFVTAFDAHAVQAFDVGAVDYLLKPFDASRFDQALARAETRFDRDAERGVDPGPPRAPRGVASASGLPRAVSRPWAGSSLFRSHTGHRMKG
jgi:two-component system, LytTR family, response regulator